jgi:uncharacterized protein (DUF952 family)
LETRPDHIFHLAIPEAWDAVKPSGEYLPAHYATDGFIHCSTAAQLRETARVHFPDRNELRIVVLRTEPLGTDLKWEASRGGEEFPHVYRGIRADGDVLQVFTVVRGDNGEWRGWGKLDLE